MRIDGIALEVIWERPKDELVKDGSIINTGIKLNLVVSENVSRVDLAMDLYIPPICEILWRVVNCVEPIASY
jgi:hypothetical protein